jgi:hypothetical protein
MELGQKRGRWGCKNPNCRDQELQSCTKLCSRECSSICPHAASTMSPTSTEHLHASATGGARLAPGSSDDKQQSQHVEGGMRGGCHCRGGDYLEMGNIGILRIPSP